MDQQQIDIEKRLNGLEEALGLMAKGMGNNSQSIKTVDNRISDCINAINILNSRIDTLYEMMGMTKR